MTDRLRETDIVARLRFWVEKDDLTDGRGPLSTDVRVLAADLIERQGKALRAVDFELARGIVYAMALCQYVLNGQVWPSSQEDFVRRVQDVLAKALADAKALDSKKAEPFITCDDCGAKLTDVRDIEITEDRCFHENCPAALTLAQTEPQTDDGEPYVSLTGTELQRYKENPLRDDSK